jgi:uncharacterized protein
VPWIAWHEGPALSPETGGPVAADSRIFAVDAVRGVALFGVLLENMYGFGADSVAWDSTPDRVAFAVMHVFFESKTWTLFSILFGLGFALQLERADSSGASLVPIYLRRLAVLFALGAAHALLFDGDILMLYAELGLALLVVRRLPTRGLLVLAASLVLVFPVAHLRSTHERLAGPNEVQRARARLEQAKRSDVHAVGTLAEVAADDANAIPADPLEDLTNPESGLAVFAMLLVGYSIGRSGVLRDIPGNAAAIARVRDVGLGFGFGAMAAERFLHVAAGYDVFRVQGAGPEIRFVGDLLFAYGITALALGYSAVLVLAAQTPRGKAVLAPLAAIGRLTLTAYLTQTLMFTTLFYGYGFGQIYRLGPVAVTFWAVVFFAVQLAASWWWSKHFLFGPVEWLWRSLTYLRRPPMRLRSDPAN